jgi:magnesium transporter
MRHSASGANPVVMPVVGWAAEVEHSRRRPLHSPSVPADETTDLPSRASESSRGAPGPDGETPEAAEGSTGITEAVEPSRSYRIRLFDADRTDREVTFEEALGTEPGERQLLWIDIVAPMHEADAAALAERLQLKPATRAWLEGVESRPLLALHGSYFTLRVGTIHAEDGREEVRWLVIVAASNTVVTVHAAPIALFDDLNTRIEADTLVGLIDAASFVTVLVDSALTSYLTAADAIEDAVDRLDAQSLRRDVGDDRLGQLVALRARITRLRRSLASHRELFAALGRADFATSVGGDVGAPFAAVAEHYDRALRAVENARDHLLGSFDVYMTRTAQRTNEIVKVLTIVSVFLLPGALIVGFMGMNEKPPYSTDDPRVFWLVVALIAAIAVGTFVVLRLRRWF